MLKDRKKIVNIKMCNLSEYLYLLSFYCLPLMSPAHSGALLSHFCDYIGLNKLHQTQTCFLLLSKIKHHPPFMSEFNKRRESFHSRISWAWVESRATANRSYGLPGTLHLLVNESLGGFAVRNHHHKTCCNLL